MTQNSKPTSSTFRQRTAAIMACLLIMVLLAGWAAPAAFATGDSPSGSSEAIPGTDSSSGGEAASMPQAPKWGEGEGKYAPQKKVSAKAVCLVNEDSGLVVYAKNADKPMTAASLVKMMTAIIVVEQVEDLDGTTITSDKSWIYDELYGKNASNADIRLGETLTVRELLYALLLPSGNEAALLLADYVSGGHMENFLFMMQNRAATLGCTSTTYVDPNGLSEENMTTARDMCLIARAFKEIPVLAEIAATPQYEMAAHEGHSGPYNIFNTDRLISDSSPYYSISNSTKGYVKGGKTGSLGEWQSLASYASNEEASYICTVLQSPHKADKLGPKLDPQTTYPALYVTALLYDWVFNGYSVRPVLDTEQPITEVPIRYTTDVDALRLYPDSDLRTLLPVDAEDNDVEKVFDLPEAVAAPVAEGDVVGTLTVRLEGELIGTAKLVTHQNVERNNTLYVVRKGQEFLTSPAMKVIITVVVIAIVGYIAVVIWLHQKKAAKGKKKNGNGGGRPRPPQ